MASNIPITNGQGQSSVAAEEISGLKYQVIKVVGGETGSTSVMGVNPDRSINVSVIGTVQTNVGNSSVISVIPGSVIAVLQSSSLIGVVTGSVVAIPTGNQSVSGAVFTGPLSTVTTNGQDGVAYGEFVNPSGEFGYPEKAVATYVFNGSNWDRARGNSSVGALVNTGTSSVITRWADSSVIARVTGSVATINQGSVVALNIGSIISLNIGSVITVNQANSIVGTYAEDSAHTTGANGLLILGVRSDTMASITSADGDYSPRIVGPAGETVVSNAPITQWVSGTADLRGGAAASGGSVTVIAAGGSSVFTYITGVQVVNFGPSSVLVTLSGGTSSIRGYTIAPISGGSNIVYANALKTNANSAFSASVSGLSSVLVSAQGFTARI